MSEKHIPVSELLAKKSREHEETKKTESALPEPLPREPRKEKHSTESESERQLKTDQNKKTAKKSIAAQEDRPKEESSREEIAQPLKEAKNEPQSDSPSSFLEPPKTAGEDSKESKKERTSSENSSKQVPPAGKAKGSEEEASFEDEGHPVVLIKGLKKKYGKTEAIADLDLAVLQGHVLGVVGTNGAGKSTLLRVLAGLIKPTEGRVEIDGKTPGMETKALVSYLPDHSFLRPDLSWKKIRKQFSKSYRDFDTPLFDAISERLELPRKKRIRDLSKGMRKRLEMALVLSRRARLYLLDEPLSDIDPAMQETIFDLLLEALGENATMVIVTHQIREMERLFDEVCFLDQGRLVRYAAAELIRSQEGTDIDTIVRTFRGTERP